MSKKIRKNKAKTKIEKEKENLKIVVDCGRRNLRILNEKGDVVYNKQFDDKLSKNGFPISFYSKGRGKITTDKILKLYTENKNYSEESKKSVKSRINKNIDSAIYEALKDYEAIQEKQDNNKVKQAKSLKYVDIMLKSYEKLDKQTAATLREKALKKAGISIEYEYNRPAMFRIKNIPETIYAISNAYKSKRSCEAKLNRIPVIKLPAMKKIANKKVNKKIHERYFSEQLSNIKNKVKEVRKLEKTNDLKNRIKEKANLFVKNNKRKLATAGIIAIAITGAVGSASAYFNSSKFLNNSKQEEQTYNKDEEEEILNMKVQNGSSKSISMSEFKDLYKVDLSNNKEVIAPEVEKNIDENPTQNINGVSIQNINGVSIQNKNIDDNSTQNINETSTQINEEEDIMEKIVIGSEFTINEGTYYEVSDGTGKTGHYENLEENKMKINYIVAIEDGQYYLYDENDGKNVAQIKEEHPNAEISYHVVTESGNIAGWNKSNENGIEEKLIENVQNSKDVEEIER